MHQIKSKAEVTNREHGKMTDFNSSCAQCSQYATATHKVRIVLDHIKFAVALLIMTRSPSSLGQDNLDAGAALRTGVNYSRSVSTNGVKCRLLGDAALLFAKIGEEEAALELFAEALDTAPLDAIELRLHLACCHAKAGFFERARFLAIETDRHHGSGSNSLDQCLYVIATTMIESGETATAEGAANEISDSFLRSLAFAEMARLLFKQGRPEFGRRTGTLAIQYFRDIAQKGIDFPLVFAKPVTDISLQMGVYQDVRTLVLQHAAASNKAITWVDVLELEANYGDLESAERIRAILKEFTVSPMVSERIQALWSLALTRNGRISDGLGILEGLQNQRVRESAHMAVVDTLVAQGKLFEARRIVATLEMPVDRERYVRLLLRLARAHEAIADQKSVDDIMGMAVAAVELDQTQPALVSIYLIGELHGQSKKGEEFRRWSKNIKAPEMQAIAFFGFTSGLLDFSLYGY